ncbi:MAG: hypothetical protein RIR79_1884 [Pseudomonadota bacterium]|jgi:CubicO group peptidase (beta-lactamase class C family)
MNFSTTQNPSGFCPQRLAHLTQVLQSDVESKRLPGAVSFIARRGEVLQHQALGLQDPAETAPMALDSIFRIYSMTKPIVSAAVLQLMESGQLLLSDPIAKHLPEFKGIQVRTEVNGEVVLRNPASPPTVQDLLRHTSGITYEILGSHPIQREYAKARLGSRDRTNREFAQALAQIPLMLEPETIWEYGRSTDLAGALVEAVSGQTLGTYLQAHILQPLGMVDTGFVIPPEKHDRIAQPFAKDPDSGLAVRLMDMRKSVALESGGAGLASTTADYARFLQCLLNGGQLDGVRILSPATVRLMTVDHLGGNIPVNHEGFSGELLPFGHGFGLGFAVRLEDGISSMLGSKGLYFWGGIAGTTFFVDPSQEFFAILMIQAPGRRDYYRDLFRNLVYTALLD